MEQRLPLPPFTLETAIQKVRAAEDGWNWRDPQRVSLAYTPQSAWRNRAEFVTGREAMVGLLSRKWAQELDRKFHWQQGRRPDEHAGLSDLGL